RSSARGLQRAYRVERQSAAHPSRDGSQPSSRRYRAARQADAGVLPRTKAGCSLIDARETPLATLQFTSLRARRPFAIDRRIRHFSPILDDAADVIGKAALRERCLVT